MINNVFMIMIMFNCKLTHTPYINPYLTYPAFLINDLHFNSTCSPYCFT